MPDLADELHGRLPPAFKWCAAAMGATVGWYYARTDASPIPLSYIALGAAAGFCLLFLMKAGIRLTKIAAIAGACLLVLNYALYIPLGYGDHLPGWIDTGKAALRWLNPAPLVGQWGKSVEIQPSER